MPVAAAGAVAPAALCVLLRFLLIYKLKQTDWIFFWPPPSSVFRLPLFCALCVVPVGHREVGDDAFCCKSLRVIGGISTTISYSVPQQCAWGRGPTAKVRVVLYARSTSLSLLTRIFWERRYASEHFEEAGTYLSHNQFQMLTPSCETPGSV